MMKLNKKNLSLIKNKKYIPLYNIDKIKPGIIHFGVGNFHRAHQAYFINRLIEKTKKNIAIIGISLRSEATKNNLLVQNNLYTLCKLSDIEENFTIISAIKEILFAPNEVETILTYISNQNIKIITITVTENGYKYDPKKNSLILDDDINGDLENRNTKTLVGFIAKGLKRRFNHNKAPLSIISCDNLSDNGKILKKLVLQFLSIYSPNIIKWVEKNVDFPNTMVDGIVPKQSLESSKIVKNKLSIIDQSAIITEPYVEWYIETENKDLVNLLKESDIKFVNNVTFYEDIKLKILNASHSALSYSGLLIGYKYVHEVINDPVCFKFITKFLENEVFPILTAPDDFDIVGYKDIILNRFKNQFIKDSISRISMDGSYKIKIRFMDTLIRNLEQKRKVKYIYFIIASWFKFLHGKDENNNIIEIIDPKKNDIDKMIKESINDNDFIKKFMNYKFVFDLTQSNQLEVIKNIKKYFLLINQHGIKKTLSKLNYD